ncbi:MAG: prepilin-type N-terminal cleavage/methylation domain-containing protein [Phycisphaeraceae bacterium]|nr:prepilin-type N-terminal cleavage/methylation domain-containing protein [Phycisphaeraceae bacterium]
MTRRTSPMDPVLSERRGFSLLECTVASAILAVVAVAGIRAGGAAGATVFLSSQRSTAMSLALSLMAEVERLPYEDPQGGSSIGVNSGENPANKTTFDDVDDYHGWTESPPQAPDGTSLTAFSGWTRTVHVQFVDPANPANTVVHNRGLKRITITVSHAGKPLATAWSLRSLAP